MKMLKGASVSAIAVLAFSQLRDAQAIPVPDTGSSCASDPTCLKIASSYSGGTAIWGDANGGGYNTGVYGSGSYIGVVGASYNGGGVGVYGYSPTTNGGLAGYFDGNVTANGVLAANSMSTPSLSTGTVTNTGTMTTTGLFAGDGDFPLGLGRHPVYGPPYVGVWKAGTCGNCATADYSLLTDGQNTFLNAPDANSSIWFRGANANRARLTAAVFTLFASTAEKPGGGVWSMYSDQRVKKDIHDLRYGLADLERVRPIMYKYNGLGGTREDNVEYVGVVAQELEKELPFMVTSNKEKLRNDDKELTDIKHVDASAFTYMLINAVKQLSADNKQMKKIICKDHPREPFCGGSAVALK